MKTNLLKVSLCMLSLTASLCFSQDAAKIFTVQNGAAPWFDRVGQWALANVPDKLLGTMQLPQQECTGRSIVVSGTPSSILIGVSESDVAGFKTQFPTAQETGDVFAMKKAEGSSMLNYKVLAFPNPPASIKGPFNSGLILLKVDGTGAGAGTAPAPAQAPAQAQQAMPLFETGPKEKFQLYLMIGQSNMLGRDTSGLDKQPTNANIGCLDGANRWVMAKEPLPPNGTGVGPGTSFAGEILGKDSSVKIGLIDCAVGGTQLSRWVKGGDLYENAVKRAKVAMEQGELKGVLWHQGESDSNNQESASTYEARLVGMIRDLRQDLGNPDLPVVVGGLGDFLKTNVDYPFAEVVRSTQEKMPGLLPKVAFVSSQGLLDKGDHLHFTSDAEVELGRRYAAAMSTLQAAQVAK